jgi:hypothetical protein
MVLDANTVVDPLAVVVEAVDTLVADVAVTGVSSAYHFAGRAEHVRFKLLYQLQEWDA